MHVGEAGLVEPAAFQIGPTTAEEQEFPRMGRVGDGTFLVWVGESRTIHWQALFGAVTTPALPMLSGFSLPPPDLDLVANPTSMMRVHGDLMDGDPRIFIRAVALGAPGSSCSPPWDCQSGVCAAFSCEAGAGVAIDAGREVELPDAGGALDGALHLCSSASAVGALPAAARCRSPCCWRSHCEIRNEEDPQ